MEEEIAGGFDTDAGRFDTDADGFDTDADLFDVVVVAGEALDVTEDAGIDVCGVADTEDVGSASTA